MRGKGVAYMRGLGRRLKESGAEGCGVERICTRWRRGNESRKREGRIG